MMRRTHEDRSIANARSGPPESSSTASTWPSDTWALLSYYQRFEGLVALILTFLIGLIIVIALFRLTMGVITEPWNERRVTINRRQEALKALVVVHQILSGPALFPYKPSRERWHQTVLLSTST